MKKSASTFLILSILLLFACAPLASLQATPTPPPTSTATPTPTATSTPTPTLTPTITPTPTPQTLRIEQVWENCEQLAQDGREIWVSGKVFMPKWRIIGYQGYKGMNFNEYLDTDERSLTILLEVGDGMQTMNALPDYFTERDLVIRSDDGQEIRHGHTLQILGLPKYKQDSKRCEIWPSRIESLMSDQVIIPAEIEINSLTTNRCSMLATQKQFITLMGSISNWGAAAKSCNMGICLLEFSDGTGKIRVTFVQGEQPSSLYLSPENKANLIDNAGNPVNLQDELILSGVLYAELEGCTLSVYEIEKQE